MVSPEIERGVQKKLSHSNWMVPIVTGKDFVDVGRAIIVQHDDGNVSCCLHGHQAVPSNY